MRVLAGMALVVVAHGLQLPVVAAVAAAEGPSALPTSFFLASGVGCTQLVYLVPMAAAALWLDQRGIALGIGLAGGLTLLVNLGFWIWLLSSPGHLVP